MHYMHVDFHPVIWRVYTCVYLRVCFRILRVLSRAHTRTRTRTRARTRTRTRTYACCARYPSTYQFRRPPFITGVVLDGAVVRKGKRDMGDLGHI
jgi:hypothetical protein